MEKSADYRGCRIKVAVHPTAGPRLNTSYTITPETEEAKAAFLQVPGSGGATYRDIDKGQGADPLDEAADFTIKIAQTDVDAVHAMAAPGRSPLDDQNRT
jgi:hypothetical protein